MSAYAGFWWTGVACGVAGAGVVLRSRGEPLVRSTFVVIASLVAFAVGAKMQHRLELLPAIEALMVGPAELLTPGFRLPLGLVMGLLVSIPVARLVHVRWAILGDALAMCAAAAIFVGRFGCMSAGCCSGLVCSQSVSFLCWRHGPGSEAYGVQRMLGLIGDEAVHSLPVHPLPLYYAIVSGVAVAFLAAMARRRAEPGTMLAVFVCWRSLARLVLEPLRALPPAGGAGLMFSIPLLALLGAAGLLIVRMLGVGGSAGVSAEGDRDAKILS